MSVSFYVNPDPSVIIYCTSRHCKNFFLIHCCFSPKACGNIFRNLLCKEIFFWNNAWLPALKGVEIHMGGFRTRLLVIWDMWQVNRNPKGPSHLHSFCCVLVWALPAWAFCLLSLSFFLLKHNYCWVVLQRLHVSLIHPVLLFASNLTPFGLQLYLPRTFLTIRSSIKSGSNRWSFSVCLPVMWIPLSFSLKFISCENGSSPLNP